MQPKAGQLEAGEWQQLLTADGRLFDDAAQRTVVLRCARLHTVKHSGQVGQEAAELLLDLFGTELVVRVLQVVVGQQVCGPRQLTFT